MTADVDGAFGIFAIDVVLPRLRRGHWLTLLCVHRLNHRQAQFRQRKFQKYNIQMKN